MNKFINKNYPIHRSCLLLLILLAIPSVAAPLDTAFTYQGRLTDGGSPANGVYDFTFSLYDTAAAGALAGDPATNHAPLVAVSGGLFTVVLDFGSNAFAGSARWLQMAVRTNGSTASHTLLSPRQPLTPAPYALYATSAGTAVSAATATIANGVAANAVTGAGIQNSTLTSNKLASGQVVKSLNTLKDDVSLTAGTNVSISPSGNSLKISVGGLWSLTGNSGTAAGGNYLGTVDEQPMELRVFGSRALRLEPNTPSPNVLGGSEYNVASPGVHGGTVAGGGGFEPGPFGITRGNLVTDHFGTVGGGEDNRAGNGNGTLDDAQFATVGGGYQNWARGLYSTVPGGEGNRATGDNSFAAGRFAYANHVGSFVWCDANGVAFASSGANQFLIRAAGGVGIGTASPGAQLHVETQNNSATDNTARFHAPKLGPNNSHIHYGLSGDWYIRSAAAGGKVILQDLGGNVGIGTSTPAAKLDVRGEVRVSVLTITGGADLAEPFEMSDQDIPEGAVVIIDRKNPGRLKMSDHAYDTHVAGIVSGAGGINPGIQLKQEGVLEQGQNVALTGRVYALADASTGPIEPGDLLTTSSVPGHAMKVTDSTRAQGAILGKAMGSLNEGRGLVLVLVSLQ